MEEDATFELQNPAENQGGNKNSSTTRPDFPDPQNSRERRITKEYLKDYEEVVKEFGETGHVLREEIQHQAWAEVHYQRHPWKQINDVAPPPGKRSIVLGQTVNNQRHQQKQYRLQPRQLTRHLLSSGETGAGKTNINYQLVDQLQDNDVPFLAFDLKQDYRHLLNTDTFEDDLIVIPWEDLQFNPLQPPKGLEKERRWMMKVVDIFGHSQHLLDASKSYLLQQVRDAWRKNDPPTLSDLQAEVRRDDTDSYKRQQYRDTVLNRLRMLTFAGETMFHHQTGLPLETLLNNNVVIELDGLNARTQSLIIETLLVKTLLYRKHHNQRGNGLRHAYLIDEAKQVFSEKKETDNPSELSTITEVITLLREFGEGIIASDQEPSKLAESLFSNTATKIMLPTSSYTQFTKIADSIGLKEEQRDWARNHLDTGNAIVYNRTTGLSPVNIPLYTGKDGKEISKNITDDEVGQTIEKHLKSD